jgi:hypothetical protein
MVIMDVATKRLTRDRIRSHLGVSCVVFAYAHDLRRRTGR